jgi:hypothetical protein
MKSIGFPPGSNNFRLLIIVILVATLWLFFFNYTNKISIATEKASIQQTKNIINSTLAVVFATYVVKGEMDRLNELNGGNPFEYLEKYDLLPATYQGEIGAENKKFSVPGWYYDGLNGLALYKTFHDDKVYYFILELDYRDVDGSGRFESGIDEYRRLNFRQLPQQ